MIGLLADYRPFLDPLPIGRHPYLWPLLILPLCAAVAVVYKCIRCRRMARVPIESLGLFVTIVLGMAFAALALAGVAKLME
jgi:hypothetical protein